MSFYSEMAQTALDLLLEFGAEHAIQRPQSTRDLVTNSIVPLTPIAGTIYAAVLPASGGTVEAFDNKFFGEELVEDKMRYVIGDALNPPFEPSAGDEFYHEGAYWLVMGCTPVNPASEPVVYQFGIKKR